jgi:hypothetical protein
MVNARFDDEKPPALRRSCSGAGCGTTSFGNSPRSSEQDACMVKRFIRSTQPLIHRLIP